MVQLSHLYMTTGKTIALAIRTFVGKVMSLLFNILSRLVIAFFQGASFNFMAVTICTDFGAQENNHTVLKMITQPQSGFLQSQEAHYFIGQLSLLLECLTGSTICSLIKKTYSHLNIMSLQIF